MAIDANKSIRAVVLAAVLAATIGGEAEAVAKRHSPSVLHDLQGATGADIYLVNPRLESRANLRPDDMRDLGCSFRVDRRQPSWAKLEHALAAAKIQPTPPMMQHDMRIGIVFLRGSEEIHTLYLVQPLPGIGKWLYGERDGQEVSVGVGLAEDVVKIAQDMGVPPCQKRMGTTRPGIG